MSKIRKYLIHLLGGVTKEENNWSIKYAIRRTGAGAADAMLLFVKNCHGLHPDEWIKTAYDYTYAMREAAMKRLEELKQQMITTKK